MLKTRLEAIDAVERQSTKQTENDMDTSSSVLGKRDRSIAEGSTTERTQQKVEGKRSRGDAPDTTMEVDPAVAPAHAQWWSPELKSKLEADPSAAVGGVDGAISARVADESNRILGQELTPEEEEMHANLATAIKPREMAARGEFDVSSPHEACKVHTQIVQTRWALTWEMVKGKKCVKARLVAKGSQDLDLMDGLVDTSGCVSLRSPHLEAVSLSAIRKWRPWSLDIKHAFSQADGFERDVFLHAPTEWGPP